MGSAADPAPGPADALRAALEAAAGPLGELSPAAATERPAPGKWSPAEVLGHLIDSAIVNLARFIWAQGRADLVFAGYDQDAWSALQGHRERPWPDTLELWLRLNHHLAEVLARIPAEEYERAREPHNLAEIAWQPLPDDQPATLAFLAHDYVGHLRHHLGQIDPALESAGR